MLLLVLGGGGGAAWWWFTGPGALVTVPDVAGVSVLEATATLVALASVILYLRLDTRFGLLMAMLMGLCLWAGASLAVASTGLWLTAGIGLFVVGWVIQFVGHYYEGRKPAFVDDVMGLVIGPLFVVAELAFLLGLRKDVEHAVVEIAGPTCIREKKALA